jgi:hypothetical protein
LFSRWHPPTEGRLEYMACGSGSGIVPRAGGNRGGAYDRRRHAIAAGATDHEGAIALCALCLIVTQRSSPGPVPPAPARQCEKEHPAGCPGLCSTARISQARLVLAAGQVPWPRRYHDVHGNLHVHVYFYMTLYLLHAPRSYPFLDCAFYCHTPYRHDTASIQHMHRYDTYDKH